MSLKERFIKENSYIIQVDINGEMWLYVEDLDNFGCAISGDFNKNNLTDNILVELHDKRGYIDTINVDNISLEMKENELIESF